MNAWEHFFTIQVPFMSDDMLDSQRLKAWEIFRHCKRRFPLAADHWAEIVVKLEKACQGRYQHGLQNS